MTALICNRCLNIPYIQFLPGLKIKFSCCKSMLITHFDLDERINFFYSLKCQRSSCLKKDAFINYTYGELICDNCLKNKKKKVFEKNIKNDNICITCKQHYKKYRYYNKTTGLLFCQDCSYPNDITDLIEFRKEKKNIEIFKDYECYENSISTYFKILFKRIRETYQIYKKNLVPNAFMNLINIKEFFDNSNILSPICPLCKDIYDIKIKNEIDKQSGLDNKEIITVEIKCNCNDDIFNSIDELENKINLVTCNSCNEVYEQKYVFYNICNESIICEKCLKNEKIIEYICLNEICYICIIHKLEYKYCCKKCKQLLCENCKVLNNHEIIKLEKLNENEKSDKIPEVIGNLKWFNKYKNYRYINKEYSYKKGCKFTFEDKKYQINKFTLNIKEKEKDSLQNIAFKKDINLRVIINKIARSIMIKKLSNSNIEIANLKEKINKMEFINITLLKELNDKNKLVQIVKTRNIFQHLISNLIKKKYNSFKKIKGDFRILYESYKYLKYQLKIKDEDNKIKTQLESIFASIEKLIKNKIIKNTNKIFINNFKNENEKNKLNFNDKIIDGYFSQITNIKTNFNNIMNDTTKIPINIKMKIFNNVFDNETKKIIDKKIFSTLKKYNQFLLNQKFINNEFVNKFKIIENTINEIEENKISENYVNTGLYKFVDLTGNYYLDELGYINDKSLNTNLINQLLQEEKDDKEYQKITIKESEEKKFLKEIKCDNNIEFNFLFSLITKIINRIGNIVHQNDDIYKILFYEICDELNPKKYELIKDKNNNNLYKFSDKKDKEKEVSINYLPIKKSDYQEYINFYNGFFEEFTKKFISLLGKEKEIDLSNKIKKEIEDSIGKINYQNEIMTILNYINDAIIFHEKFTDLFMIFPSINNGIQNLINRELEIDEIENIDLNITQNEEQDKFINIYIKNYLLIIHLRKIIELVNNNLSDYNNLSKKIYQYKIKEIILELYKEKLNKEYNIKEMFEQERLHILKSYDNYKSLKIEELQKEKKKETIELINKEIKQYSSAIDKMKNIEIKDIEDHFKDFLDFDSNSYANTKFDILLYLYQNNYI